MHDESQIRARQLPHPGVDELVLVEVLRALADPVRLEIVRTLFRADGKVNCVSSVEAMGCLSKSTLSHHFRILREAGLVRSERQGVELLNCLRFDEIETRFPGVLSAVLATGPAGAIDKTSLATPGRV